MGALLTIPAFASGVESSPFPYQSQLRIPKALSFTPRKTVTNNSWIILQSANPGTVPSDRAGSRALLREIRYNSF
jgi:hypothetical protein